MKKLILVIVVLLSGCTTPTAPLMCKDPVPLRRKVRIRYNPSDNCKPWYSKPE